MDFGPRLNQALLCPRKVAPDALDGIESKHSLGLLIRRMEVGPMVGRTNLHEHSNDDAEEARQFGHVVTLHRPSYSAAIRRRSM